MLIQGGIASLVVSFPILSYISICEYREGEAKGEERTYEYHNA
jgi:hypothetical protein